MTDPKKIIEITMDLIKKGNAKEAEAYLMNLKKRHKNESNNGK